MARDYDTTQGVAWRDVLKGIEFRLYWFYIHFTGRYEEIQDELDCKHPNMEKVQLWSSFALGECEQVFYWENVYLSLRRFLKMKPILPKKINVQFCRDFYMRESKQIDPVSCDELERTYDTRSAETPVKE